MGIYIFRVPGNDINAMYVQIKTTFLVLKLLREPLVSLPEV